MERITNNKDEFMYTIITLRFMVIIALYVDELLNASPSMYTMDHENAELSTRFRMKDLEVAQLLLGLEIHRDRPKRLLCLTQSAYTKKVLERFDMRYSQPVDISKKTGVSLTAEEKVLTDILYRQAIWGLSYQSVGFCRYI